MCLPPEAAVQAAWCWLLGSCWASGNFKIPAFTGRYAIPPVSVSPPAGLSTARGEASCFSRLMCYLFLSLEVQSKRYTSDHFDNSSAHFRKRRYIQRHSNYLKTNRLR